MTTETFTAITYLILTCACGARATGSYTEAVTVVSGFYAGRFTTSRSRRIVSVDAPKTCACGGTYRQRAIKATYRRDVPCDSRCTGAKGHVCECSCSGANHGTAA